MLDDADRAADVDELAWANFAMSRRRSPDHSTPRNERSVPINCIECGEIVPTERLQAVPRTLRCVDCAEREERK